MNLFRSEESVRAWADFAPETEKAIRPVREWAGMMMGLRVVQKRLENDFVEKSEDYGTEALGALGDALS